jgi:hypothetical protein
MLKEIANNLSSSAQGSAQGAAQQGFNNAAANNWVKYYAIIFLFGLIISSAGLLSPNIPQMVFLVNMILFLLLGIWHWIRMKNQAPAQVNFVSFLIQVSLISVLVILIGYLLGYFLFVKFLENLYCNLSFIWMLSFSVFAGLLPTVTQLTFESIAAIPPKEFKKWFYPEKTIIMDENTDLSNFVLITFVFAKKYGDGEKSNLQSKGPYGIKLGDLFYFFIQEWNYRNPEKPIQFLDANNKPFGWYFTTGSSFWRGKNYLDPDLTIRENNIKVNLIIDTERVVF